MASQAKREVEQLVEGGVGRVGLGVDDPMQFRPCGLTEDHEGI